jgi:hypothetical protein
MAKLTKAQAKRHSEAVSLLEKDTLTHDEQMFVIEHWQESAQHINSVAGAFFTPYDLATGLAIEVGPGRIIDLCAGIGTLSRSVIDYQHLNGALDVTCVEFNPAYVEVGRKVVPEANWICADVLDVPGMDLGHFSTAFSNPPFGRIKREGDKRAPRYQGSDFEFIVIDIASHIAGYGVFILPQMSAGFNYSGRPTYERQVSGKAFEFQKATGLHFEAGCGFDTAQYLREWRGVAPICEIVCVEFTATEAAASAAPAIEEIADREPIQFDMFGRAA